MQGFRYVGNIKGLDCINNEIYFRGRAGENYLVVSVLSELIKDNKIEINLKTDETDTRTEYFLRLLGENNE